jgi:hypothetical protein
MKVALLVRVASGKLCLEACILIWLVGWLLLRSIFVDIFIQCQSEQHAFNCGILFGEDVAYFTVWYFSLICLWVIETTLYSRTPVHALTDPRLGSTDSL